MPEVSSLNQAVQIGVETTEGTAVPALKKLVSAGLKFSPKFNTEEIGATGNKFNSNVVATKEWTEGPLEGAANFNELTLFLDMILGNRVTTNPTGGVYQHVYTPNLSALDVMPTITAEFGDPRVIARRVVGAYLNEFGLEFNRDNAPKLSGKGMGRAIVTGVQLSTNEVQRVTITGSPTGGTFTLTWSGQTTSAIAYNASAAAVQTALENLSNIDPGDVNVTGGPGPGTPYDVEFRGRLAQADQPAMTASGAGLTGGSSPAVAISTTTPGVAPTPYTVSPLLPTQFTCYLDPTSGALGTTKIARLVSGAVNVSDRQAPVWVVDRAAPSYVGRVETKPKVGGEMMVHADAFSDTLIGYIKAATTLFWRTESIGPLISGGHFYTLLIDMAVNFGAPDDYSDEGGVYAQKFPVTAIWDATWNKAIQVTLKNTLASP